MIAALGHAAAFAQEAGIDELLGERLPGGESGERERPAREPRQIEEIIVTAQKREQSIRDVPISISVLDGEMLRAQGVTDLRTASILLPNVQVSSNGFLADARIRGFGTIEVNKGLEQAVGMNVDGILYGLKPQIQLPLFDIDRIEVLRGPQGTLFAKNNTAGLFNIVTKGPTDELTGFLDAELGELGRRRIETAIGGPLVPGRVNFRIAGLHDERDGYIRNTSARLFPAANRREMEHQRRGLRTKLGFPSLFGADLTVAYEAIDTELTGLGSEFRETNPNMRPFYRSFDPNTDFEPGNLVGSVQAGGFFPRRSDTVVANGRYDIGEWQTEAIFGYQSLRVSDFVDADNSPAPIAESVSRDRNLQTTVEIRATSPPLPGLLGLGRLLGFSLGDTDLTAGIFYQRRAVRDSEFGVRINEAATALTAAYSNAPTPLPVNPALAGETFSDRFQTSTMFWEQTADAAAAFGHVYWNWHPRWTLLGGLRLGNEWKRADWRRVCTEGTCSLHSAALSAQDFTEHLERSELEVSPKLGLTYDWTDDTRLYATWTKGFRAFGYNEFAFRPERRFLEYNSENTTSWELGEKTTLLDGAARLNVGLYWMEVTDFQNFTNDPSGASVGSALPSVLITNAGSLRARGVEGDLTWLPTSYLTVVSSVGFNDTQYLDFKLGACARDFPNRDGDEFPQCDLTGRSFERAPEWTVNLSPSVWLPVASILKTSAPISSLGLSFLGGFTLRWQDVSYVNPNLDSRHRQPSFFLLNGHIGIRSERQGWSLQLVGENLTDEITIARTSDISGTNPAVIQGFQDPPRLLYGRLRWEF